MVYEKLCYLNDKNKDRYKNKLKTYLGNEDYIKNRCIWHLESKNSILYLCSANNEKVYEIKQIGQIIGFLQNNHPYFIKNISEVRKHKKVLNRYLLKPSDWNSLIHVHLIGCKSLSILGIDNLNIYLSKLSLLGKLEILEEHPCYSIVKCNNVDLYLVSDIKLVANQSTDIYFSNLKINSLKIANLDIADKELGVVTSLEYCFSENEFLEKIEFCDFNTKYVTNFTGLFTYCRSLKQVNIEIFNTQSAKTLNSMFYGCSSLVSLNVNHFNLENVFTVKNMFRDCLKLETLHIDAWDISKLELKFKEYFLFNTPKLTNREEIYAKIGYKN